MNRQATVRGNIHKTFNKGLVSRIYKEVLHLNNNRTNHPLKWGVKLTKHLQRKT